MNRLSFAQPVVLALLLFAGTLTIAAPSAYSQPNIPKVEWGDGHSAFCLRLLNHCFRVCFLNRMKNKEMPIAQKVIDAEKFFCHNFCSNVPQLQKYCKMKNKALLNQGDKLLAEQRKELQEINDVLRKLKEERAQLELQRQQEVRWRQRLKQERERMMLQMRQEMARRAAEKAKQKEDTQEQTQQKQALQQQHKELRALRKQLLEQASQLRKQRNKRSQQAEALKKQLAEHRKQLAEQQRLMKEERKRLALQRKMALQRKQEEQERRQMEKKRLLAMEKLRKQRAQELAELEKQRKAEQARLENLKAVAKREAALQKKQAELYRMERDAQKKKNRRLLSQLKKLKQSLQSRQRRLRRRRRRLSRKSNYQRQRKRRVRRLRRLRRRARRVRRRRGKVTGYTLFNQRKYDAAKRWYKKRGQPEMIKKINEFKATLYQARQYHNANTYKSAIPMLGQCLTLYIELGGTKGKMQTEIKRMLSNMYVVKGFAYISRRSYSSARVYFGIALRYNSKNKIAIRQTRKLRQRAEQYLSQAKEKRASNPRYARKLLRKALRLVASSDPLYRNIQKEMER